MGFDTLVGDDPQFPSTLLPVDRRYRPDLGDPARNGLIFVLALAGVIAIFVFYRYIPNPTTLETVCFFGGMVLFVFALFLFRALKAGGAVTKVIQALPMTGDGRMAQAERLLDEACLEARANPMVHGYVVYERAVAAVQRGDIPHALGMAGAVYTSRALNKPGNAMYIYWGFSISLIARCFALEGKTAEAEKWQTLARAHVLDSWSVALLTTDVILGLRTGRAATVLADAERDWAGAESVLRGFEVRALRLHCAFAAHLLAPDGERAAAAERWLAGLYPRRPGEFAHLAKHWPELQEFITAHGL